MNEYESQEQSLSQSLTAKQENSKAAVVCLVCGILSILGFGFIGLFIAGIIAGFIALSKIKKSGGTLHGTGLVIAGLILNGFSAVLTFVLCVSFLSGYIFYMNKHPQKNTEINVTAPALTSRNSSHY